jgi:hypothetical protein
MSLESELVLVSLKLIELAKVAKESATPQLTSSRARWATPEQVATLMQSLVTCITVQRAIPNAEQCVRSEMISLLQPYLKPPTEHEVESAWQAFTGSHPNVTNEQAFKAGYRGEAGPTRHRDSGAQS